VSTTTRELLFDRCRMALYATALVVLIGSLWTIAWANSLDEVPSTPSCAPSPSAGAHPAAVASVDAGGPDGLTANTADH
jgi:hypothetical protein